MLKHALRDKYATLRKTLTPAAVSLQSIAIANKLLELQIWQFECYHLFLPIPTKREIDTTPILSILQGKDKHIVIPKVTGSNTLTHYLLTDSTTLTTNKWGVPEPVDGIAIPPQQLDVVFVPLLAFDEQGNRIGYGKGYYDRFLATCRTDVLKIGLSFFKAEPKITDVNSHDVPLHFCVTPDTVYKFPVS